MLTQGNQRRKRTTRHVSINARNAQLLTVYQHLFFSVHFEICAKESRQRLLLKAVQFNVRPKYWDQNSSAQRTSSDHNMPQPKSPMVCLGYHQSSFNGRVWGENSELKLGPKGPSWAPNQILGFVAARAAPTLPSRTEARWPQARIPPRLVVGCVWLIVTEIHWFLTETEPKVGSVPPTGMREHAHKGCSSCEPELHIWVQFPHVECATGNKHCQNLAFCYFSGKICFGGAHEESCENTSKAFPNRCLACRETVALSVGGWHQ